MSIVAQQTTVYLAPTAGRRFMTKAAAINKEARAIIKKHFPEVQPHDCDAETCGWCRDPGWSLSMTSRSASSATTGCLRPS